MSPLKVIYYACIVCVWGGGVAGSSDLSFPDCTYYALTCWGHPEPYYIPVKGNTAILSSHKGCSKDIIWPTLVLRSSTKLS